MNRALLLAVVLRPRRGPNLIANGNFAADANWTKGGGWTISGGTANASATGGSTLAANPSPAALAAKQYEVTFSIVAETTAGNGVRFALGGTAGTIRNGVGTYSQIVSTTSGAAFILYAGGGGAWAGSIDNVSVREVLRP